MVTLAQKLGPYELEQELGRGAAGIVFRAMHAILKRPCALKVIQPGAGGVRPERVRREAEATARLGRHPHIVPILDVGEADGKTFIATELVDGPDLGRVLDERGALPEREALEIGRKLALALDHAHRHGVVHRDLKPSNVLVGTDGEPRLTDFGLALDLEGATLTGEGDVVGTPQYMAPEQAQSKRDQIGPRTDVYALGATLYDLLSGRPAFEGSVVGILTQIVLNDPPPLRSIRPDCSGAAAAVVARAMEKRPEDRYQTALELADDLTRALAGEATRAQPPGWVARARRLAGRHRAAVAAAGVALLVALVPAAVLLAREVSARARRDAAVRRTLEAQAAETGFDAHVRALEEAAALDPSWPVARAQLADACYMRSVERYREGDWAGMERDLRRALAAIEEAVRAEPSASSLKLAGWLTEWLGDPEGAARLYRRAAAADPASHDGQAARAAAAVIEGRSAEAIEAADRATALDPDDAIPFFHRSVARLDRGELDAALEDAERAVERMLTDDWVRAQRARVRLARGEDRLAGLDILEGLRHYPRSPVLHDALAALARREGDAGRARALEARVPAATVPGGAPPRYLDCRRAPWGAQAAAPGPAAAIVRGAGERLQAGDAEGALAEASRALGLAPANGEAYSIRARAFRALGRAADAEDDERWAALLAPRAGDAPETFKGPPGR